MEYTRQQLIDSLPKGCEALGLSDLPTAFDSGARIYAYATAPVFPGLQTTAIASMAIYRDRVGKGWTFHLFYRGASRAHV